MHASSDGLAAVVEGWVDDALESSSKEEVVTTAAATGTTTTTGSTTHTSVGNSSSSSTPIRGLVMVVGRGKNNVTGASILGPYLVRALANPSFFTPPLTARQIPNNPGRIVLAKQEVNRYIKAQLKKEEGN